MKIGMWAYVWALLLIALGPVVPASARNNEGPFLRIETAMHTASIRKMAVDREERFLATVSYDKTVRLWDLAADLQPLRVLRPPLAPGNEGKLFAVAMAPDASIVACGGFTGKTWGDGFSIYLFDRADGHMVRRIARLPHAVLHLVYSTDGRFLLAALAKGHGIRIFDTSGYRQVFADTDYLGSVYGADFDSGGRVVSVSDRGFIRLYSASFELLAKKRTVSGKAPFSVSFSPDGNRIAVGYMDSRQVDVYSGESLKRLYRTSRKGIYNGNLSSVAWSADGTRLYAAGRWSNSHGVNPIRCWRKAGRGRSTTFAADEKDTILQLISLSQGGTVFCSGDPAIGLFNADNEKVAYLGARTIDFRTPNNHLLVSEDGSTIQFKVKKEGKSIAVRFSLVDRELIRDAGADKFLRAAVTSRKHIRLRNWKNGLHPKLNGRRLELVAHEHAWCAAVTPDARQALIGGDWSLYLFDRSAHRLWRRPTGTVVRMVNVTADGRTVVAAHADGTIRWYRLEDGRLLLSLFIAADLQRWVTWTPSGYYDASIGAESLIGWHINNGPDAAADFFPIAKFRKIYYRPDLVATVLNQGGEDSARMHAQQTWGRRTRTVAVKNMLPPVVTIVSPADEFETADPSVTVHFQVRNPSREPVSSIRVLIDGRPFLIRRGAELISPDGTGEVLVRLPDKDCAVSVLAENRYSVSDPATIKIRRKGTTERVGEDIAFTIKPKLYVLAIGVSDYDLDELDLGFSAKDAADFAAAMETQKGTLYADVITRVLTDEKATRDEVLDGLDWIRMQTTSKDVAMIFIAGHGLSDNRSGVYYYLPVNADPDRLMRTAVPFSDIRSTVASMPGKVLLFIDTCYSGGLMAKGIKTRGLPVGAANDIMGAVNELSSAENGAIVFASSSKAQKSLESDQWGNGAFTKALVEGLKGKADYLHKGKITVNMLDLYVSERVKELTNGKQTPTTAKPQSIQDFPIAVVKSAAGA